MFKKTIAEKVFDFRDTAEIESIIAMLQSKRFKCYGCLDVKPFQELGRLFELQDFTELHKFPVCQCCYQKIKMLPELDSALKVHLCQRHVLRELYPTSPHYSDVKAVSVWEIGYTEGESKYGTK